MARLVAGVSWAVAWLTLHLACACRAHGLLKLGKDQGVTCSDKQRQTECANILHQVHDGRSSAEDPTVASRTLVAWQQTCTALCIPYDMRYASSPESRGFECDMSSVDVCVYRCMCVFQVCVMVERQHLIIFDSSILFYSYSMS